MGLSVRVLGLSPFAILLPEALAGRRAVLLLLWTVRGSSAGPRRPASPALVSRSRPAAVLMFRYNNPDAC